MVYQSITSSQRKYKYIYKDNKKKVEQYFRKNIFVATNIYTYI